MFFTFALDETNNTELIANWPLKGAIKINIEAKIFFRITQLDESN
jgi:hypothetical protein